MAYIAIRRSLSTLLRRTTSSTNFPSPSSRSRFLLSVFNNSPIFRTNPVQILTLTNTSGPGHSPLNNRPPKETNLRAGCDFEHWLIVFKFPDELKFSEEDKITIYVQTLASVIGSEEEAKKRIYSVSSTSFGALVSEELCSKLEDQPGVLWVLPDSYVDVPNKQYGGNLFVDGKVIHRPSRISDELETARSDLSPPSTTNRQ